MSSPEVSQVRNKQLDVLRFIAFGMVFLYHAGYLEAGFIGVDVFFVLSGYLMTESIHRIGCSKGFEGFILFAQRRFVRLFPSILTVVIAIVFVSYLIIPDIDRGEVIRTAIVSVVGLSNYYLAFSQDYFSSASIFNPLTHMWSISAELHFYCFLAVIGFIFRLSFLFVLFFVALFIFLSVFFGGADSQAYMFSHVRILSFMSGVLVYFFTRNCFLNIPFLLFFNLASLGLLVALSVAELSVFDGFPSWFLNSLLASLLTCFLVVLSLSGGFGGSFLGGFLVDVTSGLGRISYSLYLIHFPVLSFWVWVTGSVSYVGLAICFCVSLVLSFLNYRFMETAFFNWVFRKSPSRRVQWSR